jgi:hypothetical protein
MNMNYEIGEEVWVKCVGTDCWSSGRVIKINPKTIRVFNDVRGIEGNYKLQNVQKSQQK